MGVFSKINKIKGKIRKNKLTKNSSCIKVVREFWEILLVSSRKPL